MSAAANRPALAVSLLLAGLFLVSAMDSFIKLLQMPEGGDHDAGFVAWVRFAGNILVLAPLLFLGGGRHYLPRPAGWLALRGFFLAGAGVSFTVAVRDNPVPDCLALFFVMPLFTAAAEPLLNKESFDRRGFAAAGAGFVGALIVLRPGGGVYTPEILWAMAAGLFFGMYLLVTRRSTARTTVLGTAFYTSFFGTLFVTPLAGFPETLSTTRWMEHWHLLLAPGLLSAAGHYCLTAAYKYARAGFLAPFVYAELAAAVLINFVIFSHVPDFWAWFGGAIIVACGVYAVRGKRGKS